MKEKSYIIYIDTGGTFTDAVAVLPDGTFVVGKAPTTPAELDVGLFNSIEDAAKKMDKSLAAVMSHTSQIGYGTTAGTNMVVSEAPKN